MKYHQYNFNGFDNNIPPKVKGMRRVRFDIDESDDITGVSTISIVDTPAMETDFIVMDRSKKAAKEKKERRLRLLASKNRSGAL